MLCCAMLDYAMLAEGTAPNGRVTGEGVEGAADGDGPPPAESVHAYRAAEPSRLGVCVCGMRGSHMSPYMRLGLSRQESPPRPYGG